jgi:hypothetical protein
VTSLKEAAAAFLAHRRIAVAGVSRDPKGHGSNVVYKRLRECGYEVFAINPHADEIEGDRCYRTLAAVPGGVEAVVIGTRPDTSETVMRECVELGITQVWMHSSTDIGSVSKAATDYGREHGVTVIDGGCPLMFKPVTDTGHQAMRIMCALSGKLPKKV